MHIGTRIQSLMKAKHISTKAMAEHCEVTPAAVSQWFRTGRISKENLVSASQLLLVRVEEIMAGEIDIIKPETATVPTPTPSLNTLLSWLSSELLKLPQSRRKWLISSLQEFGENPADWQLLSQQLQELGVDFSLPAETADTDNDPIHTPVRRYPEPEYVMGKRVLGGERIDRRNKPRRLGDSGS